MQTFSKITTFKKKLPVFFAILIVLVLLLSRFFGVLASRSTLDATNRNQNLVGIQQQPADSLDIFFLGNSLSLCSFSTIDLWDSAGISSYILGQTGQQIQESYYLLKTALKSQHPKALVIEPTCLYEQRTIAEGAKTALREFRNYYFPVFTYHNLWKSILLPDTEPEMSYFGFVPRPDSTPQTIPDDFMVPTEDIDNIPILSAYFLDMVVDLCQKNDVEVIFITSPDISAQSMAMHNAISAYAKEKGIYYENLNLELEDLSFDPQMDFLDSEHVSTSGAKKVTDRVLDILTERFNLTDHRVDPSYQNWVDCSEYYHAHGF